MPTVLIEELHSILLYFSLFKCILIESALGGDRNLSDSVCYFCGHDSVSRQTSHTGVFIM